MATTWIVDRWTRKSDGAHTPLWGSNTVRWRVVWLDPESRREVSKSYRKRGDAEKFSVHKANELLSGVYQSDELKSKTVADAVEAWMDSKKTPKGSTLVRYRDVLDLWVLPMWGKRKLSSISRTEIDAWLSALATGKAPHAPNRNVSESKSPAALKAISVPFRASLRHAVKLGWLNRDPSDGVELPKSTRVQMDILDFPELERLIEAAGAVSDNPSDAMFVRIMGYCGLRPGECVALQVQHVDLEKCRLLVRQTVTIDINRQPVFGTPKTGEYRDVPFAPHLAATLRELVEGRSKHDMLLTSTLGHPVNIHNWRSRIWSKAVAESDLSHYKNLTPKTLRHTTASIAIRSGADVLAVQQMLGHANPTETLRTYSHLFPDTLDRVVEAVSADREEALRKAHPDSILTENTSEFAA